MESGAQSSSPIGPTATTWQGPYDLLVKYANCTGTNNTSSFNCLKSLPAEQLLAAQNAVRSTTAYSQAFIFTPTIDGDVIPDSPHDLLAQGQFAKVPFISGNNRDEGTAFTPTASTFNLTNETLVAAAFGALEPIPFNLTISEEVLALYPNDPALGSPFGTGNETFGQSPEFKQLAAIIGDAAFQSNRRWFLEQANKYGLNQTWSYQFEALTPGAAPYLGSYHGSEVQYVFGAPQAVVRGISVGSSANYTVADAALSQEMINYWLNFAWYSDPSGDGSDNNTYWPEYGSQLNLLSLNTSNITVIRDDYRAKQMDYFLDRPTVFNLKRRLSG